MSETAETMRAVNDHFVARYPGEAARALETLSPDEVREYLAGESAATAASILQRLRPDLGADVLEGLEPEQARALLSELDPARGASLVARLDPETRERYLDAVDERLRQELRALIEYPLDSAGHLMDPRVTAFRPDDVVESVLERLRALRERRVHDVFLIDDDGRLVGAVALQDVAIAQPQDHLETLARFEPTAVQATASREEVLETLEARPSASLPVVAFDSTLIGVIRPGALVEAAQQEASAGIQTMVGASKDERALSRPLFAVRKRLPWLQINLGTAFLAAAVVGLFEDTIARFTALAVLLPVVAGQSGNTGSQALAVTMRGLALREIRGRHWARVAVKEVSAASVNGVAVATTTGIGVYLWSGSEGLTLVIFSSMVLSMIMAGFAGASVPMVLTAFGQDPAQSSSIILTTVTDVVGFLSFLGIATALSSML